MVYIKQAFLMKEYISVYFACIEHNLCQKEAANEDQ